MASPSQIRYELTKKYEISLIDMIYAEIKRGIRISEYKVAGYQENRVSGSRKSG
jgi:hypothetical protein